MYYDHLRFCFKIQMLRRLFCLLFKVLHYWFYNTF